MGSLLMHATIPITHAFFSSLLCFLFCSLFFFLVLPLFFSVMIKPISLMPPTVHSYHPLYCLGFTTFTPQLLLASYRCPSKTAHWATDCPTTTIALNVLVAPLLIPRQKWLVLFLTSLCSHYSHLDKD